MGIREARGAARAGRLQAHGPQDRQGRAAARRDRGDDTATERLVDPGGFARASRVDRQPFEAEASDLRTGSGTSSENETPRRVDSEHSS